MENNKKLEEHSHTTSMTDRSQMNVTRYAYADDINTMQEKNSLILLYLSKASRIVSPFGISSLANTGMYCK